MTDNHEIRAGKIWHEPGYVGYYSVNGENKDSVLGSSEEEVVKILEDRYSDIFK